MRPPVLVNREWTTTKQLLSPTCSLQKDYPLKQPYSIGTMSGGSVVGSSSTRRAMVVRKMRRRAVSLLQLHLLAARSVSCHGKANSDRSVFTTIRFPKGSIIRNNSIAIEVIRKSYKLFPFSSQSECTNAPQKSQSPNQASS